MTGVPKETDSALVAEARRLEAAGQSQRQIAAALNRPRHWVRYSLARGNEKTIVDVMLRSLKASPHARAVDPVHVDALAKSIAEIGLVEPILIRPLLASAADGAAAFEVMAGQHRVQACIKLGRDTVPAVIREADDLTAELVLIDENLCRRDLSTAERARAVLRRKVLYELIPTAMAAFGPARPATRVAGLVLLVRRPSRPGASPLRLFMPSSAPCGATATTRPGSPRRASFSIVRSERHRRVSIFP
jgi:ParB-like chromosome segregation protein Spo0J